MVVYCGAHAVSVTDDGLQAAHALDFDDRLHGYTRPSEVFPNGEVRLVSVDGSERYRVQREGDGMRVTHETVISLPSDTAEYFENLRNMLVAHKDILTEIATAAGADPEALQALSQPKNLTAEQLAAATKAEQAVANFATGGESDLNPALRERFIESVAAIGQMVRETSRFNESTGQVEVKGLWYNGRLMRQHFNALVTWARQQR
jgi:hypothetical protein